jgi:pimeloyl-ACP methyl ester carboxylesterase
MEKRTNILGKVLAIGFLAFLNPLCLPGQNNHPKEISFIHAGDQMHGWFYPGSGPGPFSTVLLLQGSVGHDGDVLNLGESLSKEGFNVMTYNYPGSWKSEGDKSDISALESVRSAIRFVRLEKTVHFFDIDTSDIILAGYSYGGGMALLAAVADPGIRKVMTFALGDLSLTADYLEKDSAARKSFEQMVDGILANPAAARGTSGKEYVASMIRNRDAFEIRKHAPVLAKKNLLFMVGWQDNYKRMETDVLPLYRDLQAIGAGNVKMVALETDHRFMHGQKEMTDSILDWLRRMK